MKYVFRLSILVLSISAVVCADLPVTVDNTLGLNWPLDLTYLPVADNQADRIQSVLLPNGTRRPVQIERTEHETRAWFLATLGRENAHTLQLSGTPVSSGVMLQEDKDYYLIDNGTYQFRLRKGQSFSTPTPLKDVPHWNGGARVKGQPAWDGRAWFEGSGKVREVEVTILQKGPVFIDVQVIYHFETETGDLTPALPLELGKQTHTWKPNQPPREQIVKRNHHYEAKIRFVMDDPWIEINERYHLPPDPEAGSFGIHQYWMNWGKPEETPDIQGFNAADFMKIDVVTWVRWFLYDQFGGNTNQNYVPAEPRPDQKGRPFALLRPRWNQGGGGAQDFFFSSGGNNPPSVNDVLDKQLGREIRDLSRNGSEEEKAKLKDLLEQAKNESLAYRQRLSAAAEIGNMLGKEVRMLDDAYDSGNAAAGLVAAFASKWVGPYPATIAAYAYDGNRTRARFPLIDGERSGMHYGQRAYALCIGPRSAFNNLNDLVRRHTDWTLVAQMNKYILDWQRDASLAGPNAKITRKQLQELEQAYRSGKGVAAEILHEEMPELKKLLAKEQEIEVKRAKARDLSRSKEASAEEKEAAKAEEKELGNEYKNVQSKLSDSDMQLVRMITQDWNMSVKIPDAELWLQRRYQDDFLNPTQRIPRTIADYANADLFANGKPIGGPKNAALGYITTDLDSWPGWLQGWTPGNPNFHTDKYMGAIYIASAMRDHPHSNEWLAYGWDNFNQDLEKVLAAPDGTGYECPGYSGYSLRHQLGLALIFVNAGFGNPVAENPMFKGTGRWHRKLITPYDFRIERRHAAPIGDTHRWDSGLGHGFGSLAKFYKEADPDFASEMQGTWKLLTDNGLKIKTPLKTRLLESDPTIAPMDPKEMDWSGETFHGFGALMRNNFGTDQESFLSVKAGPLRGHYHNDELSYHFYANGSPISLDYNCSYTPRGDHAALHNSMTFGREGSLTHNKRQESISAMEQIFATAWPGAFAATAEADVFVAERTQSGLGMTPLYPDDHEFGRAYPNRETDTIIHRRFISMIKHPEKSDFQDYLVVRDETQSKEAQALNIHLLAREAKQEGNLILANGQYDMDMAVYVAQATDLTVEHRAWWYEDEWMTTPGDEYTIRSGENIAEWDKRMDALMRKHNVDSLPLPGWKPAWKSGRDAPNPFIGLINDTEGKAMIPPKNWKASWMYGEYQHWLRLNTAPGTPILWVLYPYPKGTEPPKFESINNGSGVRVTVNGQSEEIWLGTQTEAPEAGQAVLRRNGKTQVLLPANQVPALGQIPQQPLVK